ncbi:MAG TPA: ABC transporter substrate-binding protein [Allosphingosinicella sp.]|jgi:peptide/nickel transport system substrate-binding protein
MRRRAFLAGCGALLILAGGCRNAGTGPVAVSAIGGPPALVNPNKGPFDAPSAFLLQSVAQGLVRFNAAGEIEPALAQRWIVSDDGLRYTFRLARGTWRSGARITAQQVAARLRAAAATSSRNPLKPLLGAIDDVEAMTDDVLEISLKSPRPAFLQLLAQPEFAILHRDEGSGPYVAAAQPDRSALLTLRPPAGDEEEGDERPDSAPLLLRGEPPGRAVARFRLGAADLVLGGSLADLPLARAAGLPAASLVFDPVAGMLGLAFVRAGGPLANPAARQALSMAVDRGTFIAALRVPGLQPRESLLPVGIGELPQPAFPAWSGSPLPARRATAARMLAALGADRPVALRIAMPDGPGYRLLFSYLRRDWAAVGVRAEQVAAAAPADLRLIDEVAPATLATWYLRHFTCEGSYVCSVAADEMLAAARIAPLPQNRRALLANADRILADEAVFIPIAAPVRWSLVGTRLTGFRANPFGRHAPGELVRPGT